MSDLIGRSEVNDVIDELEVYTCGRPNTMKVEVSVLQLQRFINKLKNIPTAYDLDKVVEELEERKEEREKQYKTASMEDGSYMLSKCFSEGARAYGKAIEIVKHGGVTDDVCEWKVFDNSLTDEPQWVYETTCGKYVGEEHTSKAFVYCPYCSKKIKVVE